MKKIFAVILTAAMIAMTACGAKTANTAPAQQTQESVAASDTEQAKESAAPETQAAETQAAAVPAQTPPQNGAKHSPYPLTVYDQAGREVVIEKAPERIVSGYYISSSLLIALELDDKMVGIETKPEKRPIYKLSAPALLELPTVGSVKSFDLEACAAAQPDLVILPKKLKDAAESLTELGIPVLLVNPESGDLFIEMAQLIAEATGTEEREQLLEAFISETEEMLDELTAGNDPKSVYIGGNSAFLSTAGNGMYQSDMIAQAGGVNAAAEIDDTYWAETSYEQILAWNPEYIVLASDAEYTVEDILKDENLAALSAVTEGRVYKLPSDAEAWDSPVPGGILGSVWTANILYPELVTDKMCHDIIEEFYETFYGFSYFK